MVFFVGSTGRAGKFGAKTIDCGFQAIRGLLHTAKNFAGKRHGRLRFVDSDRGRAGSLEGVAVTQDELQLAGR